MTTCIDRSSSCESIEGEPIRRPRSFEIAVREATRRQTTVPLLGVRVSRSVREVRSSLSPTDRRSGSSRTSQRRFGLRGPGAASLEPSEKWIVAGAVIPPERIACRVWLTDQSSSVTDSSGTKSVNPAGGKTPGQDADAEDRLARGRVAQGVGDERQRAAAGVGERDQDHALGFRLLWNWLPSDWKTLRERLVDRGDDRHAEEHRSRSAASPTTARPSPRK